MRNHTVDQTMILISTMVLTAASSVSAVLPDLAPMSSFLIHKSHLLLRKLAYVDRVIWVTLLSVLIDNVQVVLLEQSLLLFVSLRVATVCLDRSESSSDLAIAISASSCSWRNHSDLLASLLLLGLHLETHLIRIISPKIVGISRGSGWEEALLISPLVVLSVVKSCVLVRIMRVDR